jgi:DNA-binding Lrp family transcriptional regulator
MVSLRDLTSLHQVAGLLAVPFFAAASIVDHLFDAWRDVILAPLLWFVRHRSPDHAIAEWLLGCFVVVTIVGVVVFLVSWLILDLDVVVARIPIVGKVIPLPIWVGLTCITAGLFIVEVVIPALPPSPLNPFWHLGLLCYGVLPNTAASDRKVPMTARPWEPDFIELWQQGIETAEIAQQLGIPPGTVQSRAHALRQQGKIQARPKSVRERVRWHREYARASGLVRVEVELPKHLLLLRRDDETVRALLIRALTALQQQATPHRTPLPETLPETHPSRPAVKKLPETLPETVPIAPTDAPLLALLRQTTPQLPYAEIAAQLGISESQVKHKATAWTKAGLLAPRPRGGARPRRARHDTP